MRKKREGQKKNPKKRSTKEAKQESAKKKMKGSTRRPKEELNDDSIEVKIEIGDEMVEFDLKQDKFDAVIPEEGHSSRRGGIVEDVGSSLGDIGGDHFEPEPSPGSLGDIGDHYERDHFELEPAKEVGGEERRIYSDNDVADVADIVDVESKITTRSSKTQLGNVGEEDPSAALKAEEVGESFERIGSQSVVGNSTTEEKKKIVRDENQEKQKDEQRFSKKTYTESAQYYPTPS